MCRVGPSPVLGQNSLLTHGETVPNLPFRCLDVQEISHVLTNLPDFCKWWQRYSASVASLCREHILEPAISHLNWQHLPFQKLTNEKNLSAFHKSSQFSPPFQVLPNHCRQCPGCKLMPAGNQQDWSVSDSFKIFWYICWDVQWTLFTSCLLLFTRSAQSVVK